MSAETVDVTTRDDSNWRKVILATRDASIDFEAVFDAANATHEQIWTDFNGETEVDINVDVDTDEWTGKAFFTSFTMEGGFAGEITLSGTLTVNGTLVKTP
jgi:predicted secreted protein